MAPLQWPQMVVDRHRTARGVIAGATAAAVWAAQQSADERLFGVRYDDTELLGKFFTRGRGWRPAGIAAHLATGGALGAVYANIDTRLPLRPAARGPVFALTEHLLTWPGTRLLDRVHPAADDFPRLWGDHRAFAQATWRHLLFGTILGELHRRLQATQDAFVEDQPVFAPAGGQGLEDAQAFEGPLGRLYRGD